MRDRSLDAYRNLHSRAVRQEQRDAAAPDRGQDKTRRVDLGISLLHAVRVPGVAYDLREIAFWAGCTESAIQQTIRKALKKLKNAAQALE